MPQGVILLFPREFFIAWAAFLEDHVSCTSGGVSAILKTEMHFKELLTLCNTKGRGKMTDPLIKNLAY